MKCEKEGCKKEAIVTLTIINKDTKERTEYFLCLRHFNIVEKHIDRGVNEQRHGTHSMAYVIALFTRRNGYIK